MLKRATVLLVLVSLAVLSQQPAFAGKPLASIVSTNPADYTPQLIPDATEKNPVTLAITSNVDSSVMYIGGRIHSVTDVTTGKTVTRNNIVAFDASTGAVKANFAPTINGEVWAIRLYQGNVYIAGTFTTVNGVAQKYVVKMNTNGVIDKTFKPTLDAPASDLRIVDNRVIVAGTFSKGLVALSPTTGANTGFLDNLAISGTLGTLSGAVGVYRIDVSSDGKHLAGIGNFWIVGTASRARAFVIDLTPTTATINDWYYTPLQNDCSALQDYLRDVDFSPDSSYFVLVSTGGVPRDGELGQTICDAAARFDLSDPHPTTPHWINYTGGDTLHSAAVSTTAVYVQGHQRWLDNPGGSDFCGPGCAPRQGIAALDPATGKALSWNPGKGRGVGGKDLVITPKGLWVGSDTADIGGERHSKIALMPAL